MTIGIDIDGVLTNIEQWQFDMGSKYTTKPIKNPDAFDAKGIYDLTADEYSEFLDLYLEDYAKNEPARKHASEVIKKLRNDKHKIIIVTGRFHTTEDTKEGQKHRDNVYNWLKKYDIEYDKIIFTGPNDNKLDILINNKVDLMIEDKASTISDLSKHMDVICFDANYNKHCNGARIYRVYSWWDIYYCIKKITKNN